MFGVLFQPIRACESQSRGHQPIAALLSFLPQSLEKPSSESRGVTHSEKALVYAEPANGEFVLLDALTDVDTTPQEMNVSS